MEEQPHYNRTATFLPIGILFLLAVGFYWKLVFTDQYVWFDHPDMCYIEIPRLEFQAREIHAWHFPLWDPSIWTGQPLIGQTQPGPLYPLNLLFYVLPLRQGYIRFDFLNWYWVVIRFLAALCCYLLCRDLKRSRSASILAGCAFAFGGFIGTVAWLDVVNGAVWTPLILLYFFRAWRGERPLASAAVSGFWLGIAWLCGHHEIPLMVSFTLLFAWIYAVFQRGRPDWSRLRPAAATFLIAGLVSAVQLWPTYEFGRLSKRWVGTFDPVGWNDQVPYTISTIYSMPVRGLLGMIFPGQGSHADSTPYLGIVVVSLALLGLVRGWSDSRVRWLAVLAALAAAYSLGALTPFQGILYAIGPMLGKARVPVRAIHLLNFAIAVLAAYGMDALLANTGGLWIRRLRLGLAAMGGLVFAAAIFAVSLNDGMLLAGVVAVSLAGVTLARQSDSIGRRATLVIVAAVALVELYNVGTTSFSSRYDKDRNKFVNVLMENKDIVAFLRSEEAQVEKAGGSPIRVSVNDQDIPTNFGDWHGIDMLGGYMAGVTTNLLRHELHTKRTQSLFGITHWIGRQPGRPDMEEIFEGTSGIKVFRNPDPMPRAWAVHDLRGVKQDYEIRLAVQDPTFDFHRNALILGEAPPPLEVCPGEDQVRLTRRRTDRVTVSAKLTCTGMVILAEPYYPGWTATVDGKPTGVWEVWGALRGVVVGGGEHEVMFSYRPLSVYGGAALTALGVLLTVVLVRRRS